MSVTPNPDILTTVDGPIARITFNRPQARNAVNRGMVNTMREFITEIATDRSVRVVIITGAGEHFMGGGDVAGFGETIAKTPDERYAEYLVRVNRSAPMFKVMQTMPQPTIAAVRGACAGAAVGFAASCDFVLGGESALFLVANVLIGATPDGSTSYSLPRKIGAARAMEMMMFGGRVNAQQAYNWGLLNKLVPDDQLQAETEKLAQQIINLPATSVRNIKSLVNQSLDNQIEYQLQLEAKSFAECAATDDFVEGVSAFLGKRKAEFNKPG